MDIIEEIRKLKQERNAVILVHNYQLPEVQDIGDFVGDSLGLSIQAAGTNAKTIVFCGVHFMAETAKILSPDKTVLLPDMHSGCPMADMITAADMKALKKEHPKAKFLCYVNTSAEVKAECDLCCTSANAASMVRDMVKKGDKVVFVPDQHLAGHAASLTGAELVTWNGFCPTHARITAEDILEKKRLHPGAVVLVHPECSAEVRAVADEIVSTEIMCLHARDKRATEFIVGTEVGIIHRLKKENPDKHFYPACDMAVCPNMKLNTLEKVLVALQDMKHSITLDREVMHRARRCIRRMLEYRA